jgi:hypothetical protein
VQGGITVEKLETVGSDSAGTRVERPTRLGATPLPEGLWGDTPGPVVERLVGLLPAVPGSLVLRDLQLRLLASSVRTPEGLTSEGALLAARLGRLRAMGALDTLTQLSRSLPQAATNETAARALTDRSLALGDPSGACGYADQYGAGSRDQYWLAVAIVCDAVAGVAGRVEFGVGMSWGSRINFSRNWVRRLPPVHRDRRLISPMHVRFMWPWPNCPKPRSRPGPRASEIRPFCWL